MENRNEMNPEEMKNASGGLMNQNSYRTQYVKKGTAECELFENGKCPSCSNALMNACCNRCRAKWVVMRLK